MMKIDIESMIQQSEANLQTVPPGFAVSVMRRLPVSSSAAIKVPLLNRRLAAAACFCAAAVIMVFTASGFDWHIVTEHSGKLSEWVSYAQNMITGGNS
jgi:hypothetical protein